MQFLLIAYDGTDPDALNLRLKVREEHFAKIAVLKKSGEFVFGGAILDESGKMIGSMILYDFPDRQSMDQKLKEEPYIINGVWKKITIQPFRLARIE
jgi:uncharacterized protein